MSVLSTHTASVELCGLTVRFGDVAALNGVDLAFGAGQIQVLLGSNGAGKSTLARVVSTLQRPTAGAARVCGWDVVADRDEVRARIAVTGQGASLDDTLTGVENLHLIAGLAGLSRRDARHRAEHLLEQVDLVDAGHRRVKTYSGGMRRRLDLAASLVADPQVVIVDEPTTGLDPVAKQAMWDLLASRARQGCAVLLTTQDLSEAQALATTITVLDRGRIVTTGTPAQLRASTGPLTLRLADDHDRTVIPVASIRDGLAAATAVAGERQLTSVSIDTPNLTDTYLAITREKK